MMAKMKYTSRLDCLPGLVEYTLSIWSRWGDKLLETHDPDEGWNGRRNNTGQDMPVGVYLGVLRYTDARDRTKVLKEFVTLVR